MSLFKILVSSGVSLLLLSSCGSSINVAGPRLDTPETLGEFKSFKASAQLHSGHKIVLKENIPFTDTLTTENPRIGYKTTWGAGLGVGLASWIDLEWETMSLLKLKMQLIGEPYKAQDAAGFSLALAGGAGVHGEAFEYDSLFNESEVSGYITEANLIAGYRFAREFLVYSGVFMARRKFTVRDYDTITNSDSTRRKVLRNELKGKINNQGVSLGAEIRFGDEHKGYTILEVAHMKTGAGNTKRAATFGGVQVGIVF